MSRPIKIQAAALIAFLRVAQFVWVLSLLVLSPSEGTSQTWVEKIRDTATTGIVFITSQATYENRVADTIEGTGFIIESSGYVLTCSHIIPPEGQTFENKIYTHVQSTGFIGSKSGAPYSLTIVRRDQQADLLLLKLPARSEPWQAISHASETCLGSDIVAFGFPLGKDLHPSHGPITSADNDGRWFTDANLEPGMSGGPAFDTSGAVIGVVAAGYASARSLNLLIPISRATSLLEYAGSSLLPIRFTDFDISVRKVLDATDADFVNLRGTLNRRDPVLGSEFYDATLGLSGSTRNMVNVMVLRDAHMQNPWIDKTSYSCALEFGVPEDIAENTYEVAKGHLKNLLQSQFRVASQDVGPPYHNIRWERTTPSADAWISLSVSSDPRGWFVWFSVVKEHPRH